MYFVTVICFLGLNAVLSMPTEKTEDLDRLLHEIFPHEDNGNKGEMPPDFSGSPDFAYDGPSHDIVNVITGRNSRHDDSDSAFVFPDDPILKPQEATTTIRPIGQEYGLHIWNPVAQNWEWMPHTTKLSPKTAQQAKNISACENYCFRFYATGEYNPLCGSNGVTYLNPARFKCALKCGRNITAEPHKMCRFKPPVL